MNYLRHHSRSAFTLIELLVVVAIISMLIAILLPSLARAREQTKSVICLSNLRALGQGVTAFTAEEKDRLPGNVPPQPDGIPLGLHPAVYRNQGIDAIMDRGVSYSTAKFSQERQLTYILRRMFNDSEGGANSITDEVSTCPAMESIVSDEHYDRFRETEGYYVYPTDYVVNNVGSIGEQAGSMNQFRATNPQYYFGFSPWLGASADIVNQALLHPPQRLSKINRPSEEWMLAGAWYRSGNPNPAFPELQQEGPYQWGWSGKALPNFAPHFANKVYDYEGQAARDDQSLRIRSGKEDGETNTVFFDGHAEPVRSKTLKMGGFTLLYGFPGTVNPFTELDQEPLWD